MSKQGQKATNRDLTQGNIGRQLFSFTLPLIIGNLFQLAYNFVDTMVVGRFAGDGALAAVGTCDPVMNLLILGVSGVCIGASVIMSRFYGAGEGKKLRAELEATLVMGLIFALAVMGLGVLLTRPILRMLRVPEEIMPDAVAYLRMIFLGLPFTCLYNIYAAALRSIGESRVPSAYLVLSTLLNMGLDVALVAGLQWGALGAGLATVIAQAVSAVLCILHVQRRIPALHCAPFRVRPDGALVRETLALGGLTALQQCSQPVGKLLIQGTVNALHSVAVIAAFNAASKIEDIGLVPGRSISNAMMTFTAQNMGAKKPGRAERGFRVGILMELACGVLVCLIVRLLMGRLMRLFTGSAQIIAEGILYFTLISFFYWLPCLTNGHQGYFRGVGAMKTVLWGTLTQISVRTAASMLLVPHMGIRGVALGCVLGWTAMLAWQAPYRLRLARRQ